MYKKIYISFCWSLDSWTICLIPFEILTNCFIMLPFTDMPLHLMEGHNQTAPCQNPKRD